MPSGVRGPDQMLEWTRLCPSCLKHLLPPALTPGPLHKLFMIQDTFHTLSLLGHFMWKILPRTLADVSPCLGRTVVMRT